MRELAEAPGVEDVHVVTNSHFRGKAVANAAMLEALVEERRVAAPAELAARYAEALGPFVEEAGAEGKGQGRLL
jgi:hypothetical protein